MNELSDLTVTALRFGFLLLIWVLIFSIVSAMRRAGAEVGDGEILEGLDQHNRRYLIGVPPSEVVFVRAPFGQGVAASDGLAHGHDLGPRPDS